MQTRSCGRVRRRGRWVAEQKQTPRLKQPLRIQRMNARDSNLQMLPGIFPFLVSIAELYSRGQPHTQLMTCSRSGYAVDGAPLGI